MTSAARQAKASENSIGNLDIPNILPRRWPGALRYHASVGWNTWFRRRRMRRFARELAITAETRVLDVGGTPEMWDMLAQRPRVTLLNTPRTKGELAGASWWVAGDGRALPFRDGAFDVVFSNSVIEHVGDAESQRRFASEV